MKYSTKIKNHLVQIKKTGKCKECFLAAVIMLVVFVIQYLVIQPQSIVEESQASILPPATASNKFYLVKRVVDGDTLIYLDGTEEKTVRLLGIDTPETKDPRKPVQCFGAEASAEAERLLDGQKIRLESDQMSETRDKYGRELRYVYLSDGMLLNAYLISEGFAAATPEFSFSLKDYFVNLEKEARMAEKGLWNPDKCPA